MVTVTGEPELPAFHEASPDVFVHVVAATTACPFAVIDDGSVSA
jgi:hypothetical protein